jgi:solute carrier family 25 carnitine/acylcarnitine transporter 20/29
LLTLSCCCCCAARLLQGNWDCAKKILRNHGLRGIYSGYVSTLLRDMQGYAWFFFGYEATIHYLAGQHGKTKADLEYWQVGTGTG